MGQGNIVFMPFWLDFYVSISTVQPLCRIRWKHAMFVEIEHNKIKVQKYGLIDKWLGAENNTCNLIVENKCFDF